MMVPAVKTPVSAVDVGRALLAAWTKLFEETPAPGSIALLLAQSALETGRWKSCWCWNLGNMKPGSKWAGDICQFRLNEVINGVTKWFDPPDPQTSMRAYPSLAAAAEDYLWMLHRRFAQCWMHVVRADPVAFSQALKAQGYYTAPEPPYTKAVRSLYLEYLRLMASGEEYAPPIPPDAPHSDHGLEELALSVAAFDAVGTDRFGHDTDPAEAPPDTDRGNNG